VYFKAETVCLKTHQQTGYSLLELSIVVLIMGIIAVVMIPNFSSTDSGKLDLAAQNLAESIRYARAESMRGGELYGVLKRNNQNKLVIKRVDQTASPWSFAERIANPLNKKDYIVDLAQLSSTRGVTMISDPVYRATCDTPRRFYFDHQGTAWCLNPNNVALKTHKLTLSLNGQSREVILDGLSGRVTIQ
jgi:prepilin-type N-terminal cleavage/methylation domain-containing protein